MSSSAKLCSHCLIPNTSTLMGHWSFDGTLDDVSYQRNGPAVLVANNSGSNIAFESEWPLDNAHAKGFISIRSPGWINVPSLGFVQNSSFTIAFSLRLNQVNTSRAPLLSNWTSNQWQFITQVDAGGTLSCTLRRNMLTAGSDPAQDLVTVKTASAVPISTWIDVAFIFDAPQRSLSVYVNGQKSNSSAIRDSVTDTQLHTSNVGVFQFGMKADDQPNTGTLNADIRDLRLFKLHDLPV